jgi:ABC-type branched-subunit amino acid transport system substrate-binding protein
MIPERLPMRNSMPGLFALALAMLAPGLAFPVRGTPLTAQEEAGRAIYEEGRSTFGEAFSGRIGMAQQALPGAAVRCANCHGSDGLGRPEGGVRPPEITWSALTRPGGHAHDNGRHHPPFDEAAIERTLVLGQDSAGNRLDATMPRFEIGPRDLAALVAYLKRLEQLRDPGIRSDTLRIGTLLPAGGSFAAAGQAVKGLLRAYFDRINGEGGIYGRRLELVAVEYANRAQAAPALRTLVTEGDVFALLAPFAADIEDELVAVANAARMPVVGPLTLLGDDPHGLNTYVFHLLAGVGELAQVLGHHVAADAALGAHPALLLYPDEPRWRTQVDTVQEQLGAQGWSHVSRFGFRPGAFDAAAVAHALESRGAGTLFVLGPGADLRAVADMAAKGGRAPLMLVPGPLASAAVLDFPPALAKRVLLAYPTLPADQKPDALREYAALFRGRDNERGYQALQVPAYSSAVLLVDVLRKTGRDVTREKLVAALEAVQGFDAGLVPPLSYNARRRVGALGGYVVARDIESGSFRPVGGFENLP